VTPHALIAPARLAGASLMRAQSDERLVDLVRAGNEAAFEAIVARHRRPLQRYCARFLSESRAEDAVQQSFLSAYNSLRSSSGDMNLRPWLYRISHNTSLNMLRERGTSYEQLSEEIDGVECPDQAAERSERLREVVSAVSSLPARQRDAILLREMEGRSYQEIAVELGVSGGAVRQLLSRGALHLAGGHERFDPLRTGRSGAVVRSRGDERPDPGDRDSSGPGSDDRAEAPGGGDSGPSLSSGSGSSGSGSTESGSSGSESSGSGSTESGSSGSGSSGSGSSWSGSGSADSSGSSSGSSVSGSGGDDALSGLND